jgi:hypothetical protein
VPDDHCPGGPIDPDATSRTGQCERSHHKDCYAAEYPREVKGSEQPTHDLALTSQQR